LDKQALKDILYGSIAEMAKNSKYYHNSSFGGKFCYFTDEGEKAVMEILNLWTLKVLEEEKQMLDKRAKELVVKGLKGEDN